MIATVPAVAPVSSSAGAAALPDHLSWSGVQCYSQCPKKFFFRYIAQAPVEFVPASLAFGGAFHRAAEHLQQARMEGAPLPAVEALLGSYDQAWKEDASKAPEVLYAKGEDAASLRELASRMLTAYRQHVVANAAQAAGVQIIAIEHAHRFTLLPGVPPIEMRLDLLELNGADLIVTDVKTSRSRWNEMKAQEHLPQLVLYSVGLVPLLRELGAKRIVPQFTVVTKAKSPAVQVLEPKASQADVDRLKRMVGETWDAVQKEVFVQREGWQCAQCPFKARCLGQ
ncbi:MAG TPA: PD-(D/E)XK nuclease family protein [Planctomycetota bacterium]|jgi:CRISPR/Cas system-associated exonuclease Cas4 (RecB family)